jgi:hypothetical protein
MSLDILEGDFLILSGSTKEYPVRSCEEWETNRMNTMGFRRMATKIGSTKRVPAITDGKRGAPEVNLVNLRCTPLDPVSAEIQKRLALESPRELLQTFLTDGDGFVHIVVEDIKNSS